jgi:hypothetical protein
MPRGEVALIDQDGKLIGLAMTDQIQQTVRPFKVLP